MQHIQAFFAAPDQVDPKANIAYNLSCLLNFPFFYLTQYDTYTVDSNSLIKHKIVNIQPFGVAISTRRTIIGCIACTILLIPTFILGTLFRSISYLSSDVRHLHSNFVAYKNRAALSATN